MKTESIKGVITSREQKDGLWLYSLSVDNEHDIDVFSKKYYPYFRKRVELVYTKNNEVERMLLLGNKRNI